MFKWFCKDTPGHVRTIIQEYTDEQLVTMFSSGVKRSITKFINTLHLCTYKTKQKKELHYKIDSSFNLTKTIVTNNLQARKHDGGSVAFQQHKLESHFGRQVVQGEGDIPEILASDIGVCAVISFV